MKDLKKQLQEWLQNQTHLTLVRIQPGKGRQTLHGTVISVSADDDQFLFYEEDRKQVEKVRFNEIEDLVPMHKSVIAQANKTFAKRNYAQQLLCSLSDEALDSLIPLLEHLKCSR